MSGKGMLRRERLRRMLRTDNIRISDGELLILIVCNMVTTIGLTGDIARHLQNPEDLSLGNDFLSSWHLVLYGGVTAVGLWLGIGALRHGPGYVVAAGCTTIGFGLLALGGVADAAWHARFGAEAKVEALVSPPHLLVFAGLAFLLSSPVVVLWRRPATRLGFVESIIAMSSVVATILVTSLFTGFLSPLSAGMSLSVGYFEPLVGESPVDYDQVRGLGMAVWTTAVLVAAFTLILVRWRPFPGVVGVSLLLCGAPALAITDPSVVRPLVIGYGVAGVTVEVMVALVGRPTLGRMGAAVTGALMASMLWASTFALLAREGRLAWTEAMWGGTVMLCALIGAVVGAIVALPAPTGGSVVDSPIGPRPA